jgi:endonuclease YncB( thermonuclease family)
MTTYCHGKTKVFFKVSDSVGNEELIRQRLPRVFTRYCDRAIRELWERLEDEAPEASRGLWSMPNATPPWEFRRSRR